MRQVGIDLSSPQPIRDCGGLRRPDDRGARSELLTAPGHEECHGSAMAEIARHRGNGVARVIAPIYLLLFPIPVVCFVAALVTDIAYSASAYLMWLHFSEWLIAAGLAFGGARGARPPDRVLREPVDPRRRDRLDAPRAVLRRAHRRADERLRPHHRRLDRGGADRHDALDHRRPPLARRGRDAVSRAGHLGLASARCGHEGRDDASPSPPASRSPPAAAARTTTSTRRPSTARTRPCPSRRAACCPTWACRRWSAGARARRRRCRRAFASRRSRPGSPIRATSIRCANGDLLIIESKKEAQEPVERPKRPVMAWVEAKAHGGSGGGPSNRILLVRGADAGAKPAAPSVLIDHLNAPFGVVLVGDSLYVADTDAILRFPFKAGDAQVGGAPVKVDGPAGRADQPPLDEEPHRERRRLEALRRRRLEQQRDGARPDRRDEPRRHPGRSIRRPAPSRCSRAACATRTGSASIRAATCSGPWSTSATSSARTWCPTT